jgi:hypothetical protein
MYWEDKSTIYYCHLIGILGFLENQKKDVPYYRLLPCHEFVFVCGEY